MRRSGWPHLAWSRGQPAAYYLDAAAGGSEAEQLAFTCLQEEGQVLDLVSLEITRNVDAFTAYTTPQQVLPATMDCQVCDGSEPLSRRTCPSAFYGTAWESGMFSHRKL